MAIDVLGTAQQEARTWWFKHQPSAFGMDDAQQEAAVKALAVKTYLDAGRSDAEQAAYLRKAVRHHLGAMAARQTDTPVDAQTMETLVNKKTDSIYDTTDAERAAFIAAALEQIPTEDASLIGAMLLADVDMAVLAAERGVSEVELRDEYSKALKRATVLLKFRGKELTQPTSSQGVRCAVCGQKLKLVDGKHLRSHGLTVTEYQRLFPQWPRVASGVSNKARKAQRKSVAVRVQKQDLRQEGECIGQQQDQEA